MVGSEGKISTRTATCICFWSAVFSAPSYLSLWGQWMASFQFTSVCHLGSIFLAIYWLFGGCPIVNLYLWKGPPNHPELNRLICHFRGTTQHIYEPSQENLKPMDYPFVWLILIPIKFLKFQEGAGYLL